MDTTEIIDTLKYVDTSTFEEIIDKIQEERNSSLTKKIVERNSLIKQRNDTYVSLSEKIVKITEDIESICPHKYSERFLYDNDDGWSNLGTIVGTWERTCSVCGKKDIYRKCS